MLVETDSELSRLRALLRDLVALSAIPGGWIGKEPHDIASGLADAVVELLQLDFGFVRLCDPGRGAAVDVMRGDGWSGFPEWLEGHLATGVPFPGRMIVENVGGGSERYAGIAIPIGVNGEGGIVVAACERGDFPNERDQLLLSVAANQAAVAFQSARLILERTRELRRSEVYLARLAAEQAALRRVATLAATDPSSAEVFAKVAEEVAQAIGGVDCVLARTEPDGTITTLAASGTGPMAGMRMGERFRVDGTSIVACVLRDGGPCRIDDYCATTSGAIGERGRQYGIRSAAGCPIVVHGEIWGVLAVAAYSEDPLPPETERRVAQFTDLVATAIANGDARAQIERLAQEQAALRRVATLVAEQASPEEVFSKVTEEVGLLVDADGAAMARYLDDDTACIVASWGSQTLPVGFEFRAQDGITARVGRTQRTARIEDYSALAEDVPAAVRDTGVRSVLGAPIVVAGGVWGALTVGSYTPNKWAPEAESQIDEFTELAATAVSNMQAQADLAASRARIVGAADEARRRIERDLHDGVQQRLVGLALKLRGAERMVSAKDPLAGELAEFGQELNGVLEELRELSRGIHPAILTQGGLDPALRGLARRSGVPVLLNVAVAGRLPEPVEVATYYIVSEALTNAAKHAKASRVEVAVESREDGLEVRIHDNGVGGARTQRGSGLTGLRDRVEAIGGTIALASPPGEGTLLHVSFPAGADSVNPSRR